MKNLFAMLGALALSLTSWAGLAGSASSHALPLRFLQDVTLPGGATRLDYQSLDPKRHHLYISHLGASAVIVVDTRTRKVMANLTGISRVHGVLAVPSLGRVYASATGVDQVDVIDEKSLHVLARIPGGDYPDGMAYDPPTHALYVSDEAGGTDTVIDTRSNRRIATIPLGGQAGNTRYDPSSGRIFVNVQTLDQLVAIDPRTHAIVARYPLPVAQGNHGLYLEPKQHLAFVACEDNARLLVVDMKTMRVIQNFSVGDVPDVLAFDPGLRLLYVASESGGVAMFREVGRALHQLGEAFLASHAHTVAVDPGTHQVYFPLQNIGGRPVLRVMRPIF